MPSAFRFFRGGLFDREIKMACRLCHLHPLGQSLLSWPWAALFITGNGKVSRLSHLTKQENMCMLTSIYKRLCCCCCSKLCLTLCNPMNCSTPGFPAFTVSCSLFKLISIELVMSSNHLTLCHPLLLPSTLLSIRVFQ